MLKVEEMMLFPIEAIVRNPSLERLSPIMDAVRKATTSLGDKKLVIISATNERGTSVGIGYKLGEKVEIHSWLGSDFHGSFNYEVELKVVL